ncbi:hypothetical protein JZ751_016039 [Albula glossodonta]|uniref:MICOS complex subunit MIC19 n=1 Tax=Albula glossodonta TaxID=121402 RepID=A0A8T2NR48_9TELE|nr:hypothetical protein JZ751_016039 [Albula glossodonta]
MDHNMYLLALQKLTDNVIKRMREISTPISPPSAPMPPTPSPPTQPSLAPVVPPSAPVEPAPLSPPTCPVAEHVPLPPLPLPEPVCVTPLPPVEPVPPSPPPPLPSPPSVEPVSPSPPLSAPTVESVVPPPPPPSSPSLQPVPPCSPAPLVETVPSPSPPIREPVLTPPPPPSVEHSPLPSSPSIEPVPLPPLSPPPPPAVKPMVHTTPPAENEEELKRKTTTGQEKGLNQETSQTEQEMPERVGEEKVQTPAQGEVWSSREEEALKRTILRDRAAAEDHRLKAWVYAHQLEQRDKQLRKQDVLYREQLAKLEEKGQKFHKVITENYHSASREVNAKFRRHMANPVCADLQAQILKCYRENPGQTLSCSRLASLYLQCVSDAKQNKTRTGG